jgi:hypothetical protein
VDAEGRAASFSAHGPTFDGRIKPDVAAMGVDVTAIKPGTRDEFSFHESDTSVFGSLTNARNGLMVKHTGFRSSCVVTTGVSTSYPG